MKNQVKILLSVLALVGFQSSYGNLVMNGSFESGSFANWILSGNTTYYQIVPPGGYVNTGAPPPGSTYFGEFGPDYPPIVVSQTIPTAIGQDYTFSFYVTTFDNIVGTGSVSGGTGSEFTASFGGDDLFDSVNTQIPNWTLESFKVQATATSETVQFTAVNPPKYYALGDISVTTVPEPTTMISGALLLLPFGAGTLRILRKRLTA